MRSSRPWMNGGSSENVRLAVAEVSSSRRPGCVSGLESIHACFEVTYISLSS